MTVTPAAKAASVSRMWRDLAVLTVVCFGASFAGGTIATYGRTGQWTAMPMLLAAMAGCATIQPSVLWRNLVLTKGLGHLLAILWRLPVACLSILLMLKFQGEQRICFVWALMTCYFVTLTLESWLQTRQANSR